MGWCVGWIKTPFTWFRCFGPRFLPPGKPALSPRRPRLAGCSGACCHGSAGGNSRGARQGPGAETPLPAAQPGVTAPLSQPVSAREGGGWAMCPSPAPAPDPTSPRAPSPAAPEANSGRLREAGSADTEPRKASTARTASADGGCGMAAAPVGAAQPATTQGAEARRAAPPEPRCPATRHPAEPGHRTTTEILT